MKRIVLWSAMLAFLVAPHTFARQESLTTEQKSKLQNINRVLIDVIALSDKGPMDAKPLADVVDKRMKELAYTVVTDSSQPHDVVFQVKCEQRKTWEGTTRMGSDADLPDSPSRVWKGPACQLSYAIEGKKMAWRKEVRTDFADAEKAAEVAKVSDPGAYAMDKLRQRLEDYDFPILITADWGQEERLFRLYDDPGTPSARKVKLIGLFGYLFSNKAVPRLLEGLKSSDLDIAKASALALGNIGQKDTVPTLVQTMKSGPPELRPAAAKALGVLGALHGDFTIVDPLLETLKTTDDITLKTEVAWALGKLPDRRAYDPLFTLQKSLFRVSDATADPQLTKLKEAVNWSIKQIDTWEYLQ